MYRGRVLLAAVMLLAATSCGGGDDDDGEVLPVATTLPLQESALAVGGDVQAQAEDVIEVGISQEQLEEIALACRDTQAIPLSEDRPCETILRPLIGGDGSSAPCRLTNICVKVFDIADAGFATEGYVEITDNRPGESLCAADPEGTCLRIGLETAAVLDRIVSSTETEPSTDTQSSTGTESSTDTESSTETESSTDTGTPSTSTTSSS